MPRGVASPAPLCGLLGMSLSSAAGGLFRRGSPAFQRALVGARHGALHWRCSANAGTLPEPVRPLSDVPMKDLYRRGSRPVSGTW